MSGTRRENHKKHQDKENLGIAGLFLSAFKSAVLSLVISLVLAIALSSLTLLSSDPLSLVFPTSLAALYACSFLSGFLCVRKMHEGALICGLFSGGIFMLIYMFITLFFPREMSAGYSFGVSVLLHLLIIVFSIVGAYAGRHRGVKRRKIKR